MFARVLRQSACAVRVARLPSRRFYQTQLKQQQSSRNAAIFTGVSAVFVASALAYSKSKKTDTAEAPKVKTVPEVREVLAEEAKEAIDEVKEAVPEVTASETIPEVAVPEVEASEPATEAPSKSTEPSTSEEAAVIASSTPKAAENSAEEGEEHKEAYDPDTGEINWDCPCLGGMADGPCGEEFKAAFSCFVYSKEEPKGIECITKFKDMQNCFRRYPDVYAEELRDDEEYGEVPNGQNQTAEKTEAPATDETAETPKIAEESADKLESVSPEAEEKATYLAAQAEQDTAIAQQQADNAKAYAEAALSEAVQEDTTPAAPAEETK